MKSKLDELLKILKSLDMLVELDVIGNVELIPLAEKEFERLKAVVHAAREARRAQETYHRNGCTQTALKIARQWEKELDKALSALWVENLSDPTRQDALL